MTLGVRLKALLPAFAAGALGAALVVAALFGLAPRAPQSASADSSDEPISADMAARLAAWMEPAERSDAVASNRLAMVEKQVADVASELAALRQTLASTVPTEAPPAMGAAPVPVAPVTVAAARSAPAPRRATVIEDPVTAEEHVERIRTRFDEIDLDFESEPVDPDWSDQTSERIETVFIEDSGLAGATLESYECRSERCRLEVVLDQDADRESMEVQLGFAMMGVTAGMSIKYDDEHVEGGVLRSIVYLKRGNFEQ